jgi:preprotein translocase subunit SecD
LCAVLLASGCASSPEKKAQKEKDQMISTLRVHPEVYGTSMDFSIRVPINREPVITITVDKEPFLTEADVTEARIVEVAGGFDVLIQFDHHGSLLLEQYTTSNPGRRLAIFSLFGKKPEESRWIAAPIISRRITSGAITFTPDASRVEAERIVLGLNNVAKQNKERNKW